MLPSINCERGHLTRNSCFKHSRWQCAHKPLLPLAPRLCLSLVGHGAVVEGELRVCGGELGLTTMGSIQVFPQQLSFIHWAAVHGASFTWKILGQVLFRAKRDLVVGFKLLKIQVKGRLGTHH